MRKIMILLFVLALGYTLTLPQWLFPRLYPTFIEAVEANWGLALPAPADEVTLLTTRDGSHGDGEAITKLSYNEQDIAHIQALSTAWTTGEHLPLAVRSLVQEVDPQASYLLLQKDATNFIVLQLNGHTLTVFESYT